MKILSKLNISTGFCDKFYSSNIVVLLNPRRFPILSSCTNVITAPCGDISIMLPRVLKLGLIVNG